MKKAIEKTAKSVRETAKKYMSKDHKVIDINYGIPYVAIELYKQEYYYFQGDEASTLLEEAVTAGNKFNVTPEDYLLHISQGW